MKTKQQLEAEIKTLSADIREAELYKLLNKTPLFSEGSNLNRDISDIESYLLTLKKQLEQVSEEKNVDEYECMIG